MARTPKTRKKTPEPSLYEQCQASFQEALPQDFADTCWRSRDAAWEEGMEALFAALDAYLDESETPENALKWVVFLRKSPYYLFAHLIHDDCEICSKARQPIHILYHIVYDDFRAALETALAGIIDHHIDRYQGDEDADTHQYEA